MSTALPVLAGDVETAPVLFHLSLNVDDLARSIDFFSLLFDQAPAKRERDYAKFELADPPLVLSLEPNRVPRGGKLNHLGFRLGSAEVLVAMQRRLEMSGISTSREEGVECCYSKQTKFWVADPDGNLWEMYTFEGDVEHRGPGQVPRQQAQPVVSPEHLPPAPSIWAHRLGDAFPARIMAETADVDEVLLQGTFNGRLTSDERRTRLAEVFRILTPGGRLQLHQLTALTSVPQLIEPLPGPAAAVEAVPSAEEIVADLAAAGFVDIRFEKLGDNPCFSADGVSCRETKLLGLKPAPVAQAGATHRVLYKGPFRQIEDDRGHVYRRGTWIEVDAATWHALQASPLAEHFALPQH
jgi:catechol 2,3-dioxygenase-like lactoylglutathione lyase family enzyme